MATEVPHARVFAAENSVDAFVWTRRTSPRVGADNATWPSSTSSDAFPELDGTVSVVVSNPPYVPDAAIPRDPEVRLFDPAAALYGGEDGLDVVRVLSGVGLRLAHPGGMLVIEHGELQGDGHPRHFSPRTAGAPPPPTPTSRSATAPRRRSARLRPRATGPRPARASLGSRPPDRLEWATCPPSSTAAMRPSSSPACASRAAIGRGELVVIPTDTVYGVAADAFNAARGAGACSTRRDAAASRRRPCSSRASRPSRARGGGARAGRALVEAFWPGGLTIVLPRSRP